MISRVDESTSGGTMVVTGVVMAVLVDVFVVVTVSVTVLLVLDTMFGSVGVGLPLPGLDGVVVRSVEKIRRVVVL